MPSINVEGGGPQQQQPRWGSDPSARAVEASVPAQEASAVTLDRTASSLDPPNVELERAGAAHDRPPGPPMGAVGAVGLSAGGHPGSQVVVDSAAPPIRAIAATMSLDPLSTPHGAALPAAAPADVPTTDGGRSLFDRGVDFGSPEGGDGAECNANALDGKGTGSKGQGGRSNGADIDASDHRASSSLSDTGDPLRVGVRCERSSAEAEDAAQQATLQSGEDGGPKDDGLQLSGGNKVANGEKSGPGVSGDSGVAGAGSEHEKLGNEVPEQDKVCGKHHWCRLSRGHAGLCRKTQPGHKMPAAKVGAKRAKNADLGDVADSGVHSLRSRRTPTLLTLEGSKALCAPEPSPSPAETEAPAAKDGAGPEEPRSLESPLPSELRCPKETWCLNARGHRGRCRYRERRGGGKRRLASTSGGEHQDARGARNGEHVPEEDMVPRSEPRAGDGPAPGLKRCRTGADAGAVADTHPGASGGLPSLPSDAVVSAREAAEYMEICRHGPVENGSATARPSRSMSELTMVHCPGETTSDCK